MQKIPLLSAIVPMAKMSGRLLNFSNWISECSNHPIELIIVEDGNDDATLREVNVILKNNLTLNYKLISGLYGSAGIARNAGIREATGRWITFWDSDDVVIVKEFVKMIEIADNRQLDAILGNFQTISELDGTLSEQPATNSIPLELIAKMPGLWRMAFRRKNIQPNAFKPFRVAEDQHFLVDIDFESMHVEHFNSVVYKYFIGGQLHVTKDRESLEDLYDSAKEMRRKLRTDGQKRTLPYLLLLRQVISTLRHCSDFVRRKILKSIFRFIFTSKFAEKKNLAQALYSSLVIELSVKMKDLFPKTVTVILAGGLGNQLFQSIAALSHAGSSPLYLESGFLNSSGKRIEGNDITRFAFPNNVKIVNSRKWSLLTKLIVSYCLRMSAKESGLGKSRFWRILVQILGSLFFTLLYRRISILKINQGVGYSKFDCGILNNVLIGYFQSHVWHNQLELKLPGYELELKSPSKILKHYSDLAHIEHPLIVHIRLGDYLKEPTFGNLPSSYFLLAYKMHIEQKQFNKLWVFSDDLEMAKGYFPSALHHNIRWIGNLDGHASTILEVMRLGEGFVLSNSSFGWWGAKLARNKSTMVVAPYPWFKHSCSPESLLPESWHTLDAWRL